MFKKFSFKEYHLQLIHYGISKVKVSVFMGIWSRGVSQGLTPIKDTYKAFILLKSHSLTTYSTSISRNSVKKCPLLIKSVSLMGK